jgi:hypothetical protein
MEVAEGEYPSADPGEKAADRNRASSGGCADANADAGVGAGAKADAEAGAR